jgi:4-amino-4-deoxy-L-arabinose transferase-like glycosyltransferase
LPQQTPQQTLRERRADLAWWLALALLWILATAADRLWLNGDGRLPSWDQADYLNSAVDHGRALGLLPGGGWQGWPALLDLSPKIPPLASLVNGSVMAVAGDSADGASWALALWHALLLVVVAGWGRQLLDRRFGLLCAALVALAPALATLRLDYTLDLPLAATTTLALWLLGRWQAPGPSGGRWPQAIAAAVAVAAALLVKQSALLLVALPSLWSAIQALAQPRRRPQALAALALVLAICLPWLKHNWITTLGGTNRAVVESAAAEGDPAPLSLASLLWYGRRLPEQLGPVLLLPALLTALLAAAGGLKRTWRRGWRKAGLRIGALPAGWGWLIGCTAAGWICTTLSPNKDGRYIAPVLPLLLIMLARLWWQLGLWISRRGSGRLAAGALAGGLLAAAIDGGLRRSAASEPIKASSLPAAIARLKREVGPAKTTLALVANRPDLNEHTLTHLGRLGGGQILARRVGRYSTDLPLTLERANWLLLASGDQGSRRPSARALSLEIRRDRRFERLEQWPWSEGRQVELWHRREAATGFDTDFIRLSRGLERGPAGLLPVLERIGIEHQLDGHFLYQQRVRNWASGRLARDPNDREALWSLSLLATIRNRPAEAEQLFARLQQLEPGNPWPGCYRSVVLLAGWNPWQAARVARQLDQRQPVARGLAYLSAVLGGALWVLPEAKRSIPAAIAAVKADLSAAKQQQQIGTPPP